MKIKPKEITRTVGILTDPDPTWMAVVDHGANQTPFNTVKRNAIAPNPTKGNDDMAIKSGKGSKRKSVIQRLTFSKSKFKEEVAVKAYLTEKGFEDYEIEDADDVWTVNSTEDTSHLTLAKAKSTATKTAGVTAFVSEITAVKSDDDDDADDDDDTDEDDDADGDDDEATPAAKTAGKAKKLKLKQPASKTDDESDDDDDSGAGDDDGDEDNVTKTVLAFPPDKDGVQKYDFWSAYMSDENSLVGVLKDGIGYDGVPPGVEEVMSAVFYSAGNVLSGTDEDGATKKQKLEQIGADFAALTYGLYELFEKATGNATKSASAKAFADSFAASIAKGTEVVLESFSIDLGGDDSDNVTETPAATKASKAAPAADADQEPAWAKKLRETSEKALAVATSAKDAAEKSTKTVSKGQRRKSFDDIGESILDPEAVAKNDEAAREERRKTARETHGGLFGIV